LPAAPATAGAQEFVTAQQLRDGSLVLASKIHTCGPVGSCAMDDPGPTYRVQRYLSTGKLDASYAQAGTFTTPSHAGNAAILTDGTTISLGATYYRTFISGLSRPFFVPRGRCRRDRAAGLRARGPVPGADDPMQSFRDGGCEQRAGQDDTGRSESA